MSLRIAMFYHSLVSDWNHGNAHFLRGVAAELSALGHQVRVFEPADAWSVQNLVRDHGAAAVTAFEKAFPGLRSDKYESSFSGLDAVLDRTDLALVHEWNEPELVARIGAYRKNHRHVRVFFHDTHHRAITARQEMDRFDLSEYDGVLAYGASLKAAYETLGWGKQVHVWHEAADTRIFQPLHKTEKKGDVVWIGNWGDDERTQELDDFLITPVSQLNLKCEIFGVRYPQHAKDKLSAAGIAYNGWLANFRVPEVFAEFRATVHVPRRPYTQQLAGIPTIRPFEALACGIPLVSAPWNDSEGLFRIGQDFLMARDGTQMQSFLRDVIHDGGLASSLAESGLETIRSRHTCKHRVNELLSIYSTIAPQACATEARETAGVTA